MERSADGAVHAQPARRVRLGVEIDEDDGGARLGETGGDVHRRRRLADTALLVRDGDDPRHAGSLMGAMIPLGLALAQPPRPKALCHAVAPCAAVPPSGPRRVSASPAGASAPGPRAAAASRASAPSSRTRRRPSRRGASAAGGRRAAGRGRRPCLRPRPAAAPLRALAPSCSPEAPRPALSRGAPSSTTVARGPTALASTPANASRPSAPRAARRSLRSQATLTRVPTPQTATACSRKRHFLPTDSTRVSDSHGAARASGMPGTPAPAPRSAKRPAPAAAGASSSTSSSASESPTSRATISSRPRAPVTLAASYPRTRIDEASQSAYGLGLEAEGGGDGVEGHAAR